MSVFQKGTPRAWLYALVLVTLAFKLVLSAVFPITGDEAYFIDWGIHPALGYYDHPPMIGWWLAALSSLSTAPWVLRLPATLLPAFMSLFLYGVLRREPAVGEDKAALVAIGLLLVPLHVWNIFVTTDAPLVFFSFLSGLAFWHALRKEGPASGWFLLAGVLLGLACLSKYFASLLGLAYLVAVLACARERHKVRGLLLAFAAAAPFIALNLYWNYENCWDNFMFNLYNRHDDAGWSWKTPLLYLLCLLYLLPVPALMAWLKRARAATGEQRRVALPLAVLAAFPLLLFAVLSLVREVGLHWLLSFLPFFFAAAAFLLDRSQLKRAAIYLGVLGAVQVVLIAAAATQPLERWKHTRIYDGIVFHFRIHDIMRELQPYQGEYEIMADGYSAGATLSYYRGRYTSVFGEASSHARHDDIVTDFRGFEGRNIAVLRKSPPRPEDYAPYFESVEYRTFVIAGSPFYIVLGRNFRYSVYRDQVLALVRDRYYRIPAYLPQGRCDFCERYFQTSCPVR